MHLVSYDISSAFAQGLTFTELAQPGEEVRAVQLMVSASDAELIREFQGWSSFDHHRHILSLQKPVYGLKDAPRSWQKRLTTLLTQAHLRPCLMDSQLFVITAQDLKEAGRSELIEKTPFENQVQAGMTAHVDDLKAATTAKFEAFLKHHLEGYIGKLTEQREKFVHVGIMHQVDSAGGVYMHQNAYVQQILVTPLGHIKQKQAEEQLDSEDQQTFNSVLGAISWLQQTRPDLASQTQALQRRAHAPRKIDLVRANQLVKYAKANPSGLYYPAFETSERDARLLAFTDSSFQARPDDNKALSIRGTAILLAASGVKQGAIKTPVHLLEFQSTKHKRVVRSTFAAELGAMVDSTDRAVGIQLLLSELFFDKRAKEARTRMAEQSHGQTVPRLVVAVDAKSVYETLACKDLHRPAEEPLTLPVQALRDDIQTGRIAELLWVDTRYQLADALTKGSISKLQITLAADKGEIDIPSGMIEVHQAKDAIDVKRVGGALQHHSQ
eukprot:1228845-Amphidinium_carterae.1